jgi:hypothetical protein
VLSQAEQTEVRLQHAGKLAWPMKLFVFGCVLFCSVWLGAVSLVLVTLCVILALLFFLDSLCVQVYINTQCL